MPTFRDTRTGRVVALRFNPGGAWVAVPEEVTGPAEGREPGGQDNDASGQPETPASSPPVETSA